MAAPLATKFRPLLAPSSPFKNFLDSLGIVYDSMLYSELLIMTLIRCSEGDFSSDGFYCSWSSEVELRTCGP